MAKWKCENKEKSVQNKNTDRIITKNKSLQMFI